MGMTLRQIKEVMGADEFYMWRLYFTIEPHDIDQANLRHAILCQEMHRTAARKILESPSYESFVPDFTKVSVVKKEENNDKKLYMQFKDFAAKHNAQYGKNYKGEDLNNG